MELEKTGSSLNCLNLSFQDRVATIIQKVNRDYLMIEIGFPTGRNFLVLWDKGTEVLSLFWDKRTEGKKRASKKIWKKTNDNFWLFDFLFAKWFCPGTPRDREVCPGIFLLPLSRDKGTAGQGKSFCSMKKGRAEQGHFFVPGQRCNGTSRPLETLDWTLTKKY